MRIFALEYVAGDPVIDPDLIPLVAARFKALGEPGRLAILAALQSGEMSVSELVRATGREQPNVSQHLSSLAAAGLVESRREGNRMIYRTTDPTLVRICDAVCRSLAARARDEIALRKPLRAVPARVRSRG
jgi:DNA-binding transcriptional ArsR family regulator